MNMHVMSDHFHNHTMIPVCDRYVNLTRIPAATISHLYCWQTDTFHLEAIGLGELQKIIIGYESDPRWSLDKVTIRESDDAAEEYVFTR